MVQFFGPGNILRPRSVTILRQPSAALLNPTTFRAALAAFVFTANPVAAEFNDRAWHADVTLSQQLSRSMAVSSHPVESGFEITDHVRRMPDILQIQSIISDTPLGLLSAAGAGGVIRGRAVHQFNKLNEIFEAREPVFVATSMRVYKSMIIMNLDAIRDQDTGAAVGVSLTLKEVIIRSLNLLTSVLPDDDALGLGAGGTVDLGTSATSVVL